MARKQTARETRPAIRGHFPKSWSYGKKAQYQHMVGQIASEVTFRPRSRGSRGDGISGKEYKRVESFYKILFGNGAEDGQVGLLRGSVRARFKFPSTRQTRKLQAELGQQIDGLRYAYIDSMFKPGSDHIFPVEVEHRDGAPDVVTINHVSRYTYHFDEGALATDPKGEVARALEYLGDRDGDKYSIHVSNGRFLKESPVTSDMVPKVVRQLMKEYNNPKDNHYWGNWLSSVVKFKPHDQASAKQFAREYNEHLERLKDLHPKR